MSPETFIGWQHYYLRNPFGDSIQQTQLALVAFLIYESSRGEDGEKFLIEDFMPERLEDTGEPSDDLVQEVVARQLGSFQNKFGDIGALPTIGDAPIVMR